MLLHAASGTISVLQSTWPWRQNRRVHKGFQKHLEEEESKGRVPHAMVRLAYLLHVRRKQVPAAT